MPSQEIQPTLGLKNISHLWKKNPKPQNKPAPSLKRNRPNNGDITPEPKVGRQEEPRSNIRALRRGQTATFLNEKRMTQTPITPKSQQDTVPSFLCQPEFKFRDFSSSLVPKKLDEDISEIEFKVSDNEDIGNSTYLMILHINELPR
jgi:hypothetical protein